jgi:hypothetical protein
MDRTLTAKAAYLVGSAMADEVEIITSPEQTEIEVVVVASGTASEKARSCWWSHGDLNPGLPACEADQRDASPAFQALLTASIVPHRAGVPVSTS